MQRSKLQELVEKLISVRCAFIQIAELSLEKIIDCLGRSRVAVGCGHFICPIELSLHQRGCQKSAPSTELNWVPKAKFDTPTEALVASETRNRPDVTAMALKNRQRTRTYRFGWLFGGRG